MLADLDGLARDKVKEENDDSMIQTRETLLKELLKNKIPDSWIKLKAREELGLGEAYMEREDEVCMALMRHFNTIKDEQLLTLFSKEEPAMRNELKQLTEKKRTMENRKEAINREADKEEGEGTEKRETGDWCGACTGRTCV